MFDQPGLSAVARRVRVLLPLPIDKPLDYLLPDGEEAPPGSLVVVPLNGRDVIGVVWDGEPDRAVPIGKMKRARAVLTKVRIAPALRQFIDWVGAYTLSSPGDVLAMTLRVHAMSPARPAIALRAVPDAEARGGRKTEARQRVIAVLKGSAIAARDLRLQAQVSPQVLRGMLGAGLLQTVTIAEPPCPEWPKLGPAELSAEQQTAAAALREAVGQRRFSVTLLQGATGSGKTEVYFEALRACLEEGRPAMILLPEIALTTQWLRRFEQRFGVAPAVWHSDLSGTTRRAMWGSVAGGRAPVVVGARSALFLPFSDLGLIVVDEEHDPAFKQEDGVVYHARDMAVVRGRLAEAAVVLVSATPSLETVFNAEAGRYARLDLPNRFGGAVLPSIIAVDLRVDAPARGSFLSPLLITAIERTLERGEQVLLFLNRRGYAPMTLCRACGHRVECPNCTAWLVEHRVRRVLVCHHCAHTTVVPAFCPVCGAAESLVPVGPGVERVSEEVAKQFPDARRLVMASDTISGPHAATAAAQAIERREIDLVIGTQMVAKGWHFPHLTLVGVVDADLGLGGGDIRAAERTMQLLHQVAGRAGREQAPGTVLLQTHQPEHPVVQALIAGDLAGFMQAEAAQRRPGLWPPYGRLAALIVSAARAADADEAARQLGRVAPKGEGVVVLGPAPAPLALLRGRHRRRLLLRTARDIAVQPLIRRWLADAKTSRRVRVQVDVDPISFL